MNTPWFNDAVKAIRAEATKVAFPGDKDPIAAILDRFIIKLFSSCAHEGKLGADECVACRAFRTESAEDLAKKHEKALKASQATAAGLSTQLDHAEAEKVALAEALSQEEVATGNLAGLLSGLEGDLKKVQTNGQDCAKERAVAQRVCEDLSSKLKVLGNEYAQVSQAVAKARVVHAKMEEALNG